MPNDRSNDGNDPRADRQVSEPEKITSPRGAQLPDPDDTASRDDAAAYTTGVHEQTRPSMDRLEGARPPEPPPSGTQTRDDER